MSFWLRKWETGEIGFHRDSAHPALSKYFSALPQGRVLVPLCGKSLDLLWLSAQGHQVIGVELSPIASKVFFSENNLVHQSEKRGEFVLYQGDRIQIWCGDFFRLPPAAWEGVSAVYDRAALVALPGKLREKYARIFAQNLPDKTEIRLLLIAFEFPSGWIEGPPYSIERTEIERLYGGRFKIEELYRVPIPELSASGPASQGAQVLEVGYLLSG